MVSRFSAASVHTVKPVTKPPETVYKHSHFKSFRIHTYRQLRVLAEIDRYLPSVTPLDSTLTKITPANFSRMNTYEKRGRGGGQFQNGTNARQHSTKVAVQSTRLSRSVPMISRTCVL